MIYIILCAIVFFIVLYILYNQGYVIMQKKMAVLFVARKGGKQAKFSSCTGKIQRMLRVKESKVFHFVLETELSSGTVELKLLDSKKQPIAIFCNTNHIADIELRARERYYFVFEFDHASGSYHLDWI